MPLDLRRLLKTAHMHSRRATKISEASVLLQEDEGSQGGTCSGPPGFHQQHGYAQNWEVVVSILQCLARIAVDFDNIIRVCFWISVIGLLMDTDLAALPREHVGLQ